MDKFVEYAPIIIIILVFMVQQRLVVTPEQLERKHREILKDAEQKFSTKSDYENVKTDLGEMKDKVDKIYDKMFEV